MPRGVPPLSPVPPGRRARGREHRAGTGVPGAGGFARARVQPWSDAARAGAVGGAGGETTS